ncbi:hypothetical protein T08_13832 [Trichinella sp. T8]|nr:hypothetical protein T08_13832 [Trichinella sp. T8]
MPLSYSFTKPITFLEVFDLTLAILKLAEVVDLGFVQKERDSNYRQRHLATVAWWQRTPNSFFPITPQAWAKKKHVWQNPASSDKLLKIVLYEYHYGAIHPFAQPPVAGDLFKLRYKLIESLFTCSIVHATVPDFQMDSQCLCGMVNKVKQLLVPAADNLMRSIPAPAVTLSQQPHTSLILPPGRKSWVSLRTAVKHCVPGLLPRWKMRGSF